MLIKKGLPGVFAVCIALSMLCAAPAQAAKGFKDLSFMGGYVERHPTYGRAFKPFLDSAAKAFPNELSFNYFSTGTLYPEREAFTAVSDGRVDIGVINPGMVPGQLNLIDVVGIPGLTPNSVVGALVIQEVAEKFPEVQAEFPDQTISFTNWASAAYQLHTLKPVKTLDDIKGLKIIVWTANGLEGIKALGGNPIRLPSADTYLALSKAMADGVYCPTAPLRSYKITETTKSHLMFGMGTDSFTMFMYKPLFDSMPAPMQKWFKENSGMKLALECGKSLLDGEIADITWMKEQGHTFYYPNDTERAKFLEKLKGFEDAWLKVQEGYGFKIAPEVLKFAKERVAYHMEQMRKGAYGDYAGYI